ncbi:MAG: hypothetical protein VB035_04715 [Candidatus Fimivivens sp.]|nr:hypothetical protein [Candidatus Fimivivens sp.]
MPGVLPCRRSGIRTFSFGASTPNLPSSIGNGFAGAPAAARLTPTPNPCPHRGRGTFLPPNPQGGYEFVGGGCPTRVCCRPTQTR